MSRKRLRQNKAKKRSKELKRRRRSWFAEDSVDEKENTHQDSDDKKPQDDF